ncbi:hypothetical protein Pst134EA_032082 [Puccinia striiformis f. sp. tritici]|uniref:uncharacterized protein n=1 Tax=Puccinia striiformis f. sp. tritici TaxID=168172 RepID=UPI0020081BE0|nr:uncharacterized protein Pst134EA_032082 [Puccinia striiformis f. sp. tritici]KAH9441923.1 hypothetical protein Pst134EA_032082 [Puccinia striiformis f. sp. tritici]
MKIWFHFLNVGSIFVKPTSANRKLLAEILPNALVNLYQRTCISEFAGIQFSTCQAYATLIEIMQRIVQLDAAERSTYQPQFLASIDLVCYLQVICLAASNNKELLEINGQLIDFISREFTIYVHSRR